MATFKKVITEASTNAVGASLLNVSGNGTSGQFLASDGDGTMTWTDATSPNDSTITISGTGIGNGSFTTNASSNTTVTINVALEELSTETADIVGNEDYLIYIDDDTNKKMLIENVKLSKFNNDLTSVAGDFTVTGNDIKSSSATAITLSGADVAVAGDLTVTGNDIKSSSATALTLSGANVDVKGDLTVTGNDIKSSGGTTAITLSGANVTIAGDLTVTGTTITTATETLEIADNKMILNSDLTGSTAVDTGIVANRADATGNKFQHLFWDESKTAWAIGSHDTDSAFPASSSLLQVNNQTDGAPDNTNNDAALGGLVYDFENNEMYIRTA